MRTKLRSKVTLLFMTLGLLLAFPAIVLADDLRNNIDATFDANFEILGLEAGQVPADSDTVNIVLQGQGSDGEGGCNVDSGEGPVTVKAVSSNSSVASVKWASTNTDTVNFTDCAAPNSKNLTVTAGSTGSANVTFEITNGTLNTTTGLYTVSSTGSGTYDVSTARFTVNVDPPPNNPPDVSVTGVEHGAVYEYNDVPEAGCSVTDDNDTNPTTDPVIDSSGLDSNGLGTETVTCSYTDGGGLEETASATYTIVDTTDPVLDLPANITEEATGPNGATVNYTATATDELYGSVDVTCDPPSGTFPVGTTTVNCSATDGSDNTAEGSFTVTVEDTTAPALTLPDDITEEATGPNGNVVNYTATAEDVVDGDLGDADCTPASGSTFPITTTTVNCSATDAAGNIATGSFTVTVEDTIAPSSSADLSPAANANGWNKDDVTVTLSASDSGSGVKEIRYTTDGSAPNGSSTLYSAPFTVSSTTTVNFRAEDKAGNVESPVNTAQVNIDKAAPTITGSRTPGANADLWNNTDVKVSFTCGDTGGSGVDTCSDPTTLSSEGAGQSVTGNAADKAGNTASATVSGINIDKTAPSVSVTGVSNGATYTLGTVPAAGCTTNDQPNLSGVKTNATLQPLSGGPVGAVTATCSGALDKAGNPGSASVTYNVNFNWTGFFSPVDNGTTYNTVKAGSSIPVKFNLGGNQGLNIFYVAKPSDTYQGSYPLSAKVPCNASSPQDLIEETVTAGQSSLTYDTSANQYVYVWKTDKSYAGTCRQLQVKLADGTMHTALFNFTK
jgi:hypothetical protein